MARLRSIERAKPEYSQEDENRFRREVENHLFRIISELQLISSGAHTQVSLYSKREALRTAPFGVTVYS